MFEELKRAISSRRLRKQKSLTKQRHIDVAGSVLLSDPDHHYAAGLLANAISDCSVSCDVRLSAIECLEAQFARLGKEKREYFSGNLATAFYALNQNADVHYARIACNLLKALVQHSWWEKDGLQPGVRSVSLAVFHSALQHEDATVQKHAIIGILDYGQTRSLPVLLQRIQSERFHRIQDAVAAVGQIGGCDVLPHLLDLANAAHSVARDAATTAITKMKGEHPDLLASLFRLASASKDTRQSFDDVPAWDWLLACNDECTPPEESVRLLLALAQNVDPRERKFVDGAVDLLLWIVSRLRALLEQELSKGSACNLDAGILKAIADFESAGVRPLGAYTRPRTRADSPVRISIACSGCNKRFLVAPKTIGKPAECKDCGCSFPVDVNFVPTLEQFGETTPYDPPKGDETIEGALKSLDRSNCKHLSTKLGRLSCVTEAEALWSLAWDWSSWVDARGKPITRVLDWPSEHLTWEYECVARTSSVESTILFAALKFTTPGFNVSQLVRNLAETQNPVHHLLGGYHYVGKGGHFDTRVIIYRVGESEFLCSVRSEWQHFCSCGDSVGVCAIDYASSPGFSPRV